MNRSSSGVAEQINQFSRARLNSTISRDEIVLPYEDSDDFFYRGLLSSEMTIPELESLAHNLIVKLSADKLRSLVVFIGKKKK